MKKICFQSLVMLAAFATTLFLFSRVNWLSVFHLDSRLIEEKVGNLYWSMYENEANFVTHSSVTQPLDSLLSVLCSANQLERSSVRLYVVRSREVNAYACPGGRIVVCSALLKDCRSEAELCGVMAHELAHVQEGHVMKKLIKELGITVLAQLVTGSEGAGLLREIGQLLSSTAYSRQMEQEADDIAVTYLQEARISPLPMADFFIRLSHENKVPELMEWISTHPDSEKRATHIRKKAQQKSITYRNVLDEAAWEQLKLVIQSCE